MHKSIILITLMLAACGNSADISPKSIVREPAANVLLAQIPAGFSVVEQSPSGYFVRLTSPERASTKVITGDAKVNFPVQVCFRVPKAVDSKVVLDEEGPSALSDIRQRLDKYSII